MGISRDLNTPPPHFPSFSSGVGVSAGPGDVALTVLCKRWPDGVVPRHPPYLTPESVLPCSIPYLTSVVRLCFLADRDPATYLLTSQLRLAASTSSDLPSPDEHAAGCFLTADERSQQPAALERSTAQTWTTEGTGRPRRAGEDDLHIYTYTCQGRLVSCCPVASCGSCAARQRTNRGLQDSEVGPSHSLVHLHQAPGRDSRHAAYPSICLHETRAGVPAYSRPRSGSPSLSRCSVPCRPSSTTR